VIPGFIGFGSSASVATSAVNGFVVAFGFALARLWPHREIGSFKSASPDAFVVFKRRT